MSLDEVTSAYLIIEKTQMACRVQIQGHSRHYQVESGRMRSHELILEHVWKIRMLPILIVLSEVVITQTSIF